MLTVAIQIDHLSSGLITDTAPNVSFALESDVPGEALAHAIIRCGDWSARTTDQVNNRCEVPLEPWRVYEVNIEVTTTSGATATGNATFATGRLTEPWCAAWITDPDLEVAPRQSPIPLTFRRRIQITKPLQRAFIASTALGIYELEFNGAKVGVDYFAPGFTSYAHQIQYQTYDITDQVQRENLLTATVGGGWAVGAFNYVRKNQISADRQALLLELHLEYTDGTTEIIGTDRTWEVTTDGPFRAAEWYDGEEYDATVDLSQVKWRPIALTAPRAAPALLAQYGPPVRAQEVLEPISVTQAPSGEWIYDFGQNCAGVISVQLDGRVGQTLVFRHAEVLSDGELFTKSLRTAKATATYHCTDGAQHYSPRLTYMGFRYVGMTGADPSEVELHLIVLHSDVPEVGNFECSNPLINRLHQNIRWGGKSNFVEIPTDCPQRDERQGWTGDIAVFARTATALFDTSRFFDKWLRDLRAEQGPRGGLPMVVPKAGDSWPAMATSCWGDSCALVPWAEYLARGDLSLLARQYPAIKRFIAAAKGWAALNSPTEPGRYIWELPFHFGDWCAPGESAREWISKGKWVGTAYLANTCGIAARIADILGYVDDAGYYRALRRHIAAAFREVFTDGCGKLKKEFQTGYVLPLAFELTEGAETEAMAEHLVELVTANGNRLATGFTGTPHLLFALSDHGYVDKAYELLLQDQCPSWLYTVKAGGTTIWERWDALRPDGSVNISELTGSDSDDKSDGGMVSFNHYAMGAVGDWLYRRVAGVEATSGGYRTFRVEPLVGGGLTHAKATVQSPYGLVASAWSRKGDRFQIEVTVPVSTRCTLVLPDGQQHQLTSGTHRFKCRLPGPPSPAETRAAMSLSEKVALGSGETFWTTKAFPKHQIRSLFLADGPHGLRKQEALDHNFGLQADVGTTCFPTASALASSWDVELLEQVGRAIGREARQIGVDVVLGPGVNMKRNPLAGRNFEYFSEDPQLSGELASAWITGLQAQGVGAALKHFAANNQEAKRMNGDSLVDERTLREYYLPAFEIAVRRTQPTLVMCAYNKLNGTHCSDHRWLLWDVLREDWGFQGAVVTDWGATNDRIAGVKAGLDLEMPGSLGRFDGEVCNAIRSGALDEAEVDAMVERLLTLIERVSPTEPDDNPPDLFEQHHQLAREVAAQCGVLLSNDGLLPLAADQELTVLGQLALTPRYQGTGSSLVAATQVTSLLDGLQEHDVPHTFAPGYCIADVSDQELLDEALALAARPGPVVVCIGLTDIFESEGYDRTTLTLPSNQVRLLEAVLAVNSDVVVVLAGGAPVELPWAARVRAILHLQLAGQAGGLAAADLLLGVVNPSGKLAETYPLRYSDVVSSSYFGKNPRLVPYLESFYCGYRYFDTVGSAVRFPFGHGLSYTTFSYSELRVAGVDADTWRVSCTVQNTGTVAGSEVVQLYVAAHTDGVYRPCHELRGFAKVHLAPGESTEVVIDLDRRAFAYFDVAAQQWQVEAGEYDLEVGASSRDIRATCRLQLDGVPPRRSPVSDWYYTLKGVPTRDDFATVYGNYPGGVPQTEGSYDLSSSIAEMKETSMLCRVIYWGMERAIAKDTGGKVDYSNAQFKMLMDASADNPMRAMPLLSPGLMKVPVVEFIVDVANGHPIRGLGRLRRLMGGAQ